VPAGVFKPGRNVIVMRVLGGGGPTGAPANRTIGLGDGQAIPLPAAWKVRRGSALRGVAQPPAPWDMLTSYTTLYNGMIAPLVGYKFKLAAWYQGEANADAAEEYRSLLPMLVSDWRQRFGQPTPSRTTRTPGWPSRSTWATVSTSTRPRRRSSASVSRGRHASSPTARRWRRAARRPSRRRARARTSS
jgi:sialate O-acetylesterase